MGSPDDIVLLRTKSDRRGPFSHHWLELETSGGIVVFGFGPATVPFIDAGQIALRDEHGNVERYSGLHPLQPLTLPPLGYEYAREPGEGSDIAKPIPMSRRQADRLIQHFRELRRVRPYVPLLNDCRTFVCRVKAKARGKSTLPCHLPIEGHLVAATDSLPSIRTWKSSHKNGQFTILRLFEGEQQSFPKLPQQAGYERAVIGKWHLAAEPTGFDYWNLLGCVDSVDESAGRIPDYLDESGLAAKTIVVYTSDNGYFPWRGRLDRGTQDRLLVPEDQRLGVV